MMPATNNRGFTITELVIVLVLVGILSAGAMSLFSSNRGFSAFVAKDQFIASALEAQQIALAMESSNTPSSLSISLVTASGNTNWVFTVNKNGIVSPVSTMVTNTSGGSLSIDGVALSGTQTFNYDQTGSLTTGTNHRLVFTADNSYIVCLAASGYAYDSAGGCP